jgi:DNA-binding transcriptional MerR regulator
MTTTAGNAQRARNLRIGEVVGQLAGEFPDISISKVRYLEDEGLLAPRRTQGGYRLFVDEDVERLRTILRLQRDEFLPLRVIRDELEAPGAAERKRRRPAPIGAPEDELTLEELSERSGVPLALLKELEEFGLLSPHGSGHDKRYRESDADVAATCARLTRFGVDARHLRTFRTSADRQAALLEQILAPSLRGRNAERRAQGVRELEQLSELAAELQALLFRRALRDVATPT